MVSLYPFETVIQGPVGVSTTVAVYCKESSVTGH